MPNTRSKSRRVGAARSKYMRYDNSEVDREFMTSSMNRLKNNPGNTTAQREIGGLYKAEVHTVICISFVRDTEYFFNLFATQS